MTVITASFQQPVYKDQNLLLSPILMLALLPHWNLWTAHYWQHCVWLVERRESSGSTLLLPVLLK